MYRQTSNKLLFEIFVSLCAKGALIEMVNAHIFCIADEIASH